MKLRKLKNDWQAHVLEAEDIEPTLFSYETAVAWYKTRTNEVVVIKGYESYSRTTSKHINEWKRQLGVEI